MCGLAEWEIMKKRDIPSEPSVLFARGPVQINVLKYKQLRNGRARVEWRPHLQNRRPDHLKSDWCQVAQHELSVQGSGKMDCVMVECFNRGIMSCRREIVSPQYVVLAILILEHCPVLVLTFLKRG